GVFVVHPRPLAQPPVEIVIALRRWPQRAETPDHSQQACARRIKQLDEEVLLAPEVLVEGGPGDPHRSGDVVDGGGVKAALAEQSQRRVDNRLARPSPSLTDHRTRRTVAGPPGYATRRRRKRVG